MPRTAWHGEHTKSSWCVTVHRSPGHVVVAWWRSAIRREPVRLHSVRLIYDVTVEEAVPRAETGGSTDAVRWVYVADLEALPLIPWLHELLVRYL